MEKYLVPGKKKKSSKKSKKTSKKKKKSSKKKKKTINKKKLEIEGVDFIFVDSERFIDKKVFLHDEKWPKNDIHNIVLRHLANPIYVFPQFPDNIARWHEISLEECQKAIDDLRKTHSDLIHLPIWNTWPNAYELEDQTKYWEVKKIKKIVQVKQYLN